MESGYLVATIELLESCSMFTRPYAPAPFPDFPAFTVERWVRLFAGSTRFFIVLKGTARSSAGDLEADFEAATAGAGAPAPPTGTADLLTKEALTALDATTVSGAAFGDAFGAAKAATEAEAVAAAARSAARFAFLLFLAVDILYFRKESIPFTIANRTPPHSESATARRPSYFFRIM